MSCCAGVRAARKTSSSVRRLQVHGRNPQLFIEKSPACARQFWYNDVSNIMKRYALTILAAGGIAALGAGCVERQVVYVPAQPGAPAGAVVTDQAPPPQQVEAVPVAPGPEYVWMPGCRWVTATPTGESQLGGFAAIHPLTPGLSTCCDGRREHREDTQDPSQK